MNSLGTMEDSELDPDPLRQFERWFEDARATDLRAPEAMALATATPDGRPSARMVLLKDADERGFAFYTNFERRKGGELAANPQAALLFHWPPLGRQVRIEGPCRAGRARPSRPPTSATRPLGSRLAAWASPPEPAAHQPGRARAALRRRGFERSSATRCRRRPTGAVSGSFPDAYEFWQHGDDRLHDRIRFTNATAPAGRRRAWPPSLV